MIPVWQDKSKYGYNKQPSSINLPAIYNTEDEYTT